MFFHRRTEPAIPTSAGRFAHRAAIWRKAFPDGGADVRHAAQWVLHNVVVHPLLGVAAFVGPEALQAATDLHQVSSAWLSRGYAETGDDPPVIPEGKGRAWLLHNVVAHIAIGLAPCETTFAFHDATAKAMGVPGWV